MSSTQNKNKTVNFNYCNTYCKTNRNLILLINNNIITSKTGSYIRADTDLGRYLAEFEYMLHAAMKGIKQRYQASKSLKDTRAKNDEQLDLAQKFNDETQAIKSNLKEAENKGKVLEKDIEELSKMLAAKQQEKATLDNAKSKMQEEMEQKAQDGIKIAKEVLDSRKILKVLENEHVTACLRVDIAYKNYQALKERCPF